MLNQIVIVGRLVGEIEVKESEEGRKSSKITIAVPKNYKNADGEYDTDFIDCILWNGIAENAQSYCHKGDLLGVKGRVEGQDGKIQVIAEKITFLSSRNSVKDEEK